MPTRAYINSTVTEMVYRGLYELNRARPADPVEFFAYYLLKHNPKAKNAQEKTEVKVTEESKASEVV
jgi:hypothetical protein